ncbi:MAG: EAL domain-containing protein [Candidatus Electrothrix aestuarii]|uniref:EAL domain-containing protein n=1 Tax=Candidatus Electrothrix aestuarii TaxID=3062594 RepID=A0AAU8M109_9BACT|nr:MAG: EAL domain-containing protein [Candidatus Electrothrix sp. GW3-3]
MLETKIYYEDSKVLRNFVEAYRSVYQQAFVENHISLDEGNMYLLPVMAISKISEEFTQVTGGRVTVNAVTDRPRNLNNKADDVELKAIEFFRKNTSAQEYFEPVRKGKDQFFFYASPFYIKKMCLQCHGSREEVLPDVAQKYSTALDYKEGDLRGVISIKMKKANIRNELINLFFVKTTLVTLAGSLLFLTVIFFLIRKLKQQDAQYTQELEKTVQNQTGELQEQVNLLREYSKVLDASLIVSKGDLEGNITYVNDKMCQVFGYGPSELIGRPHSFLQHSDMDDHVFLELWKSIQAKRIWQGLLKNRKKDGSHCWAQTTVCPILDNTGEIVEYIAARADVTELVENRQEMQALLTTDNLTGLPNRYQMLIDLSHQTLMTVILFDIHAFADINDYFGIETGDRILVEFVRRLQRECEDKPCELYKLPGDQTALLVTEEWSLPEVEATVEQFTDCITRKPFYVNDSEIAVHVTCGIAWNVEKNGLLEADIALKQAKKNRQEYVVNKESGNFMLELEKNHSIAVDIKNALREGRVVTFFQPIIRAATGEIDKYECLVRIIDEDGTVLSPYLFLDAAKKARIYTKITMAVIDRACAAFADSTMEFSVNLSTQDILDLAVVRHLKKRLGKSSIGSRAILEIVETEGFENYDEVAEFIKEMKEMGCKIAIDDFGSGHSNYERLMKLQVDYLKIDGSILKKLTSDEISQTIVETIVAVAKKLGIQTVAEFVYDKDTAELATSLGVDFLQGYYFSEPLKEVKS